MFGKTSRCIAAASILALVFATGCDRAVEELKQKAMGAATKAVGDKISEKVNEKVSEVVVEKIATAALEKEGMKNVKADLGSDGSKLSLTDKDGKTLSAATGNAVQLTEADFGVAFYPGAKLDAEKAIKLTRDNTVSCSAEFATAEKFDKVSAFYREKLKAITGKRHYQEVADGSSNLQFMLVDPDQSDLLMVGIEAPSDGDTTIRLTAQKKTAPAK